MNRRLLLVDGSNLLFQMFFGMPSRIVNEQGKAIQGTLGFVGALRKIINRVEPTHLAVLFDGEHEDARAALDPEYKSNRADYSQVPEEENPFSQIHDVYAALDYMGIIHTEAVFCEADDLIAGYALTYGKQTDMVISSFDSDFFQLLTDWVSILRYRGKDTVIWTPESLKEKFGIVPAQYADFKSLTGDKADHIKGAEGIGPRTAAWLLGRFGTLENLLAHADEIEKPSTRESVIRNTERLRRNYQLISLSAREHLPFALGELKYDRRESDTGEVLRGIGLRGNNSMTEQKEDRK